MRFQPFDIVEHLSKFPVVAIDTETTGLHWYRDKAFGAAVAVYDGQRIQSCYYDFRTKPKVLDILRKELPKCKRVVNHNVKFDVHMLANEGVLVRPDSLECTMVRAALINEHERAYNLDSLCVKYLGRGKTEIYTRLADLFGGQPTKAVQMKNLYRAPENVVAEYATPDPELALSLWLWQEEQIKSQNLHEVWSLEKKLTPVLVDIERGGVRVDVSGSEQALIRINRLLIDKERTLRDICGRVVNANSGPQIREVFGAKKIDDKHWVADNGVVLTCTDGGVASIDATALRLMAARGDARAQAILDVRKAVKARSFITNHILAHEVNGYVYPNYNQTKGDNDLGTGTGRFSVNDPALQQIPKRDKEIASVVRALFVPDKGNDWCCADWEQFEFRWFAHYVNNDALNQTYEENPDSDFHQMVANLTGLPRSARFAGDANAKQINLGLVFGMGQGKLAAEMGLEYTVEDRNGREWLIPGEKAREVFTQYHTAIPGVKSLLEQASSVAKTRGYVKTVMGRHIRFPGGQFTHKAAGLVFQGSSADSMKQKLIELHPMAKKEGFRILLSVHDEIDFSIPKGKAKSISKKVKEVLETFDGEKCPIKCRIPIRSDVNLGINWWVACKG